MQGVAALKKQLQKSYRIVKQICEQWETFRKETQPNVTLIGNYLEQCQCCRDATVVEPILTSFPDVKEKVLFKIISEIELKIEHLQLKLEPMEAACDRITKQKNNTIDEYKRHKIDLTLDVMTETHTTCPSLSHLIEWLVDIDRIFRELFLGKKFWLESIANADWSDIEKLQQEWIEDEVDSLQQIRDILCFVKFFLEEKL